MSNKVLKFAAGDLVITGCDNTTYEALLSKKPVHIAPNSLFLVIDVLKDENFFTVTMLHSSGYVTCNVHISEYWHAFYSKVTA